jgi:predicted DNA-binding transcriptional regulator AlpA
MQKRNIAPRERQRRDKQSAVAIAQGLPQCERAWVTGPTLRKLLNISAVTLWRWRHRKESGFPSAKSINGRLYFYWPDVQAWLDKQTVAA